MSKPGGDPSSGISSGGHAAAEPRTIRLLHLPPHERAHAHLAGEWIWRWRRCKAQPVAIESVVANLIRAGPGLVPGCVHVMDDLAALDHVRAGIGSHGAKKRFRLSSRRNISLRLLATGIDDNGHHPSFRPISNESHRNRRG